MKEKGLKHVKFSTTDGSLEATPSMGIDNAILDLVSGRTTVKHVKKLGVILSMGQILSIA